MQDKRLMNNGIRSWKRGSWCLVKLCWSMRQSPRFVPLLPGGINHASAALWQYVYVYASRSDIIGPSP